MHIRPAKVSDARQINALIGTFAEQDKMLFRSLADIYEHLQTFLVAQEDDQVVGCCALEVVWSDLAEIKSLAVAQGHQSKGIGTAFVTAALEKARELGIGKVFALTMEPGFFKRLGFVEVPRESLPMKVWRDCARCPKQQSCDEVAVLRSPA
ncbi:MAG: N-acetyltransferase [Sedimentisphaerales bacterium]|jgi:amino-acid N-acetyltransferase|nr:N-acetyltransferase [Sedimentisphaerales bacterium]